MQTPPPVKSLPPRRILAKADTKLDAGALPVLDHQPVWQVQNQTAPPGRLEPEIRKPAEYENTDFWPISKKITPEHVRVSELSDRGCR